MIIFLYGPDSFRSWKKLKEIAERYRSLHKSGLNLRTFNLEEDSFESFRDAADSVSMFNEKKLIILKGALESKEFEDKFLKWEKKDSLIEDKDAALVFFEKNTDKNSLLFKWLKDNSKSQEFSELSGTKLKSWILNHVNSKGVSIDSAAVFTLMSFFGGDLWALENEISKLASYVKHGSDNQIIKKRDVDIFIKSKPETHIFSLVDSFAEGNKSKALKLLNGHLESGDSEQYLFSLIYKQFRNIAQINDLMRRSKSSPFSISKILAIHPFVAKKSIQQASWIKEDQIKKIYELLADIDIKIKTGSISVRHELERLLY